jgi:hypothetical protein
MKNLRTLILSNNCIRSLPVEWFEGFKVESGTKIKENYFFVFIFFQ